MTSSSKPQDDLGLYVNFPVSDAIRRAPSDANQAAEVLRLAAKLMRERQVLPYELADYLADAFDEAMGQVEDKRASALGHQLNLKARHKRRHKFDWVDVYRLWEKNPDLKRPRLVELIMKRLKCSEKVARNLLDETIKAMKQNNLILSRELAAELPEGKA